MTEKKKGGGWGETHCQDALVGSNEDVGRKGHEHTPRSRRIRGRIRRRIRVYYRYSKSTYISKVSGKVTRTRVARAAYVAASISAETKVESQVT